MIEDRGDLRELLRAAVRQRRKKLQFRNEDLEMRAEAIKTQPAVAPTFEEIEAQRLECVRVLTAFDEQVNLFDQKAPGLTRLLKSRVGLAVHTLTLPHY